MFYYKPCTVGTVLMQLCEEFVCSCCRCCCYCCYNYVIIYLGWNFESASQVVTTMFFGSNSSGLLLLRCAMAVLIPQLVLEHLPGISPSLPKGWIVNRISLNLWPKYSHSWPCLARTAGVRSSKDTT